MSTDITHAENLINKKRNIKQKIKQQQQSTTVQTGKEITHKHIVFYFIDMKKLVPDYMLV